MTPIIEIMAEVGEDRQLHLPPNCPKGIHRVVIYVEDESVHPAAELQLGDPALRWKNGLLVINLPEQPKLDLDTDAILEEIREERFRQAIGVME